MEPSGQPRRAVIRLALAFLAQAIGITLTVLWLGGKDGAIYNPTDLVWLVAPAVALADCGIAHAWVWLGLLLGLGCVALIRLGADPGATLLSWLRLAGVNAGGMAAYCLLAWWVFSRWPTPTPLLTPYEDQPAEKATYLRWFNDGARDAMFGAGEIICVLGWTEAESHGYFSGHEAARPIWVRATDMGCFGELPFQAAALRRGDILAIHNWLADPKVKVVARDQDGRTTLHLACNTGLDIPSTIGRLLARGADVNAIDSVGCRPLHLAVRHGRLSVIRVLVEAGAAVNAPSDTGYTPLHRAAGAGHAKVVQYLIEHGARVEARSQKHGATPLMSAAIEARVEAAKALIALGADVNARDNRGECVLEHADSSTSIKVNPVFCLLLEHGADTRFIATLDPRRQAEIRKLIEECRTAAKEHKPQPTGEKAAPPR